MRKHTGTDFQLGKFLLESIHLEDQEGDGKITLKLISGRLVLRMGRG
jgi:hypothetical protein